MSAIIRRNERSWAIEIITNINRIAHNNDLSIKRAGGESTISTGRGNTMFPDVVLYGNDEQSIILQGWELKMPDVPIEEETFIKDAQRKAVALNLNSCLIWNFTYAVLYIRGEKDVFRKVKQWSDTSHIKTRPDVDTYRSDWEMLLEKVILEINQYFVSGEFHTSPLGDVISNATITTLVQRNKVLVADKLKESAFRDAVIEAYIDNWWIDIRSEYEHDETDKYQAYAKSVILNWSNRIIFAHIIKNRQNAAMQINDLDYATAPFEANNIFKSITSKCDFYNVFSSINYNEILPDLTWQDFVEFSIFLRQNGIEQLDQSALQNILEGSVNTTKREINGQYTTPPELAKILVQLVIRDWSDTMLDCCCGTGTIPKAAIQIKKSMSDARSAIESVWACDKYQYPLQVANISMADSDTINLANRIFQHNALTLKVGEKVSITNPETGNQMELALPQFGAIASNLPFVPFEIIPGDDKDEIAKMPQCSDMDGRSDLYCYITISIAKMLKPGGMLGIITSNSWLGTNTGTKLVEALRKDYELVQVHISGKGRWFKNADVVTTIMVLKKKSANSSDKTRFFLWKKFLSDFTENSDFEHKLVNSALLNKELDADITEVATYSQSQMEALHGMNVSYNALFHKIDWLLSMQDKIIQINIVFDVFRGSRRGWDAMFYPKSGEHKIEKQFLRKVLINARHVNHLDAVADANAFCCGETIEDLKNSGLVGALAWIEKFREQKNGVGKPLPQVLKHANMQWYELQENEIAEIFTMMNPDQRLFFARFETPSFVNQRLIGLRHRSEFSDEKLNHALLNSMFTMFYIEASGFGRGLGVLDVNKDSISKCFMLNPKQVSQENRTKILTAFASLKTRSIKKMSEELYEPDRVTFEHIVLQSFGVDNHFEEIRQSLLSMQKARATVKEDKKAANYDFANRSTFAMVAESPVPYRKN